MASKKVSYKNLLKEAISEFDTSKNVEVKGPMLDPVLSWDGGGEIPTHKDAASILERYYFNEDQEELVEIDEVTEGEYNDDGKPDSGASMKNAKGAGTEQAGTSDGAMDKREEEIAKEQEELAKEQDEKKEDDEEEDKAAEAAPEEVKEDEVTEDIENAVIEKLIAEMEEEEEEKPEEGAEEEVKEDAEVEEAEVISYTGEGPKPGMEAPKEKQQKDTQQDAHGAGTQQAGTGVDAGQVPDRKDMADTFVKPAKVAQEGEEVKEQDAAVKPEEDEEELDVDKEVTQEVSPPVDGRVPPDKLKDKMGGEGDEEVEESLEQAFKIFSEAIEDESE